MKIRELLQNIRESVYNGPEFQYRRLSNRYLWRVFLDTRNMLLKDRANRGKIIAYENYQTLCVEVKEEKCDCEGCKQYTAKVPDILGYNLGLLVSKIETEGGKVLSYVDYSLYDSYKSANFVKTFGGVVTFHNGRLLIVSGYPPKRVKITAVFADPAQVKDCGEEKCMSYLDKDIHFQQDLLKHTFNLMINKNAELRQKDKGGPPEDNQ